ncbi:MAG: hypothetical protein AB1Z98_02075 [Nannocystaceae bacterium]
MDAARGTQGRGWMLGLAATLGLAASSLGCVIEAPSGDPGLCEDVQCSIDGYCRDGDCYCDRGFLGNPYALRGCQSTMPGTGCTTTCGLNSYCDRGACVCEEGFIAACGTGDCLALRQLCDGVPDCPNSNDEAPQTCAQQIVQQWTVADDCSDGVGIGWRLWSRDRDWAWPNADEVFVTEGEGRPSHEEVECLKGELMCFGAVAGDRSWGVGIDGTGTCDRCCYYCREDPVDFGGLGCE